MKKKRKKTSQLKAFIKAHERARFDRRYWKSFFLNLLSSAFTALLLVTIFIFVLSNLITFIGDSGGVQTLFSSDNVVNLLGNLFIIIGVIAAGLGLVLFLFKGFFKGVMWQIISRSKFKGFFRTKYMLFRIFFLVFLIILIPVFTNIFYEITAREILLIIIFLVVLNIYCFSTVKLVLTNKLKKSLRDGILNGVKVHKFILLLIYFALIISVYISVVFLMFSVFAEKTPNTGLAIDLYYTIFTKVYSSYPLIIVAYAIWLLVVAYLRIFYFEYVKSYFLIN